MHTIPTPPSAVTDAASRLRRLLQRADAYAASGQRAAAIGSLESALALQADCVPALLLLSELQLLEGHHNAARGAALQALSGHLDSPRTALRLMRALNAVSESGLMLEMAKQLPTELWDSAQSLAEVAQELTLVGAHDLAREFARAGLARDPRHPPSLYMSATVDLFYGDLDAAAVRAEQCLQIIPDEPNSHWLLSRIRKPGAEQRVERIERALSRVTPGEDEAWLAYALHNELHELREYPRAWQALERGCRVKREQLRYEPESANHLFDQLRTWTDEEAAREDGHRSSDITPIFIIGLHRSGTTLAERVLSGHSQITAGGETYDIRAQLRRASGMHFFGELDPEIVRRRDRFNYAAIGEGYLQGIAWRAQGARFVTDKLPSNYFNLGFIARALPQARFIHLRRNPIDVGLSSLRTLFSHACPYSYEQSDFVAHYRNYEALMAQWRRLFPQRILDLDYDDLVNAPEQSAAAMAAFCGLPFEAEMTRIEARNDAVATASSVMMREGIRRDRGKLWKSYEEQLQPIINAFADQA